MDIEESGHTDVASAKNQVKIAMSALEKMRAELTKLDDEGSLPSWWTNKVAIAVDKLDGMADYLDTQVEDINLDEIVIQAKDVRNRLRGVNFDIKDPDDKDGPFVITVAKKDLEKSKNAMRTHPEYKNGNIKVVSEENKMNESKDDFEPHMMYDPKTGKEYKADTYEDHLRMKEMGYVHEKPKMKEEVDENVQRVANAISFYEAKSSSGYELYHKDFSSAMQHAYAFAKKKYGITIDPKEIDDKVATGPKKPSKGKVNSYRLKGDKGQVQIQVTNLDNKRYELNMYKEEVELGEWTISDVEIAMKKRYGKVDKKAIEKLKKVQHRGNVDRNDLVKVGHGKLNVESVELDEAKYEYDGKVVKISKKEFAKVHKDYKNSTKGKERMLVLDPKTQGTISVPVQFEELEEARQLKNPKKEILVVKNNKVIVIDKKDAKEYLNKGWELAEEVELDENAAVKVLKKQADVSNPDDKKFFQKAADLLKKKDFVALGQHLYDYDTAPSEFAMSAIRDKDKASFKKMYGDQKGYFSTMKPKGLKEEVDENIQRVANAISFYEAKKLSPAARARRDALRDIGGRGKGDGDDEPKATDADREKADRNIINKLKKAADVKGNYEIKFDKGPSKKIPFKLLTLVLKKLDTMKPADKLKFQKQAEKSYADFLRAVKGIAK